MMTNFDIGVTHPKTPHLLCDLIEILLITNYFKKSEISTEDVIDLLGRVPVNNEEVDEVDAEDEKARGDAERRDLADKYLEDAWKHFLYRASSFNCFYPFEVGGKSIKIHADLTRQQRLYRMLLAFSRLRSFKKRGIPQRWANIFTRVCRRAMQTLVPASTVVKIFDANSEDRKNYFGTNLHDALNKLGNELAAAHINVSEIKKESTSGDAGLDLVGVFKFNDNAPGSYTVAGQCGAQEKNWPSKTLEAHPGKFKGFFQLLTTWQTLMFVPVCYRVSDGSWVKSSSASEALLVDRNRIIQLLENSLVNDNNGVDEELALFEGEFLEFCE